MRQPGKRETERNRLQPVRKVCGHGCFRMQERKKRMKVRCIALDLDGTTLTDAKTVSEANREALEDAAAGGVCIVVASGRTVDSIPDAVKAMDCIEYAVTSNGAAVYRLQDRACLRRVTLERRAVEAVLALTGGGGVTCEAFVDGIPYGQADYVEDPVRFGAAPYAVEYIQTTRRKVGDIRQFILENSDRLDGVDLIIPEDEKRCGLREALAGCGERLYITSSVRNRIELSSPEAGKASGLLFLLKRLGISPKETAAFGDADNDMDMLKAVRWGIAVANASEGCLRAAAFRTRSNQEDGVAWGIREILGIPERQ